MVVMLLVDIAFVYYAAETALDHATKVPTMMIFFGFEVRKQHQHRLTL
jgi:hypothetical protein